MKRIGSMSLAALALLSTAHWTHAETRAEERLAQPMRFAQLFSQPAQEKIAAPQILIIGLDLSASNPLISKSADSAPYRTNSAKQVKDAIAGSADGMLPPLPPGSMILLRTFGDFDPLNQPIQVDVIPVQRQNRHQAAQLIHDAIANLPPLMEKRCQQKFPGAGRGRREFDECLRGQKWTYITGFLEEMARLAKEKSAAYHDPLERALQRKFEFRTRILLLSDAIESTPQFDLDNPRVKALPAPNLQIDRCDELAILGLGLGGNPKKENPAARVTRINDAWTRWSQSAGCPNFIGKHQW